MTPPKLDGLRSPRQPARLPSEQGADTAQPPRSSATRRADSEPLGALQSNRTASSSRRSMAPRNATGFAQPHGRPFESISKAFEKAFPIEEFAPVPDKIHTVWVGSMPGQSQVAYLKSWARKNPDAAVNLWMDSRQLGAYAANKAVASEIAQDVGDTQAFHKERLFRGLVSQLKVATQGTDASALRLALAELAKELNRPANAALKATLLPGGGPLEDAHAGQMLQRFEAHVRPQDERFFSAERKILDQTVKAWDAAEASTAPTGIDHPALAALQDELRRECPNIQVRDLSHGADMPAFENRDAYRHEVVGRGGAYPAASDLARYEILFNEGGVYADIDLECKQPLKGLMAHPGLMLVGLADGKREVSGSETRYFANALLASHAGSPLLKDMIKDLAREHDEMKGNEFEGSRYFGRPNKSTIERTGPNRLRGHVGDAILRTAAQPEASWREDAQSRADRIWDKGDPRHREFWSVVDSHLKFPDDLVEFETEEQQNSATRNMMA